MPSTGTVDGFAAREANGCSGSAANGWNGRFAHLYETGRMRRVYLRGHTNILKRVLLHTAALNLGLLTRTLCGVGTPRSLQGRVASLPCCVGSLIRLPETLWDVIWAMYRRRDSAPYSRIARLVRRPCLSKPFFTTAWQ
jgi:hypothetical protein